MDIKDMIKPEDDVDRLAREKGVDREAAWKLLQDRKERTEVEKIREKELFDSAIQEEEEQKKKDDLLATYQVFYKDTKGNIRINCPRLAKLIMNEDGNSFIVIRDNQEILWFNGSYYEPNGERIIEQRINYYLDDSMTTKHKQETMTFIKTKQFTKRDDLEPPVNLINLKNGVFNTETKQLLPHSPEYKFLNEIPVVYNKDAKIDKIQTFLEETLDMNDIPLIQEFFGDCLQRIYSYKRAIMCVGPRDTGKTQLLQLFDIFLGHDNVSNVNLWDLCTDRFAAIELYRKLANVCSELDPNEITHIDKFLSLTGGDWQSGQKKHQDRFKFRNYAKIIFACNQIPDTKNKNEAFYVRWIVIIFNNIIPFENQIEDYYKILTAEEELSGLLNWSLEGLYRLKEKHGYSEHKSIEEIRELMQKGSNPIREFVDQYVIADTTGEVTKEEMYLSYVEFCKNLGYPFKADNVFSRKFKPELKHGVTVTEEKPRKGGRKMVWRGIICTFSRIGDLAVLDDFMDEKKDTGVQQDEK